MTPSDVPTVLDEKAAAELTRARALEALRARHRWKQLARVRSLWKERAKLQRSEHLQRQKETLAVKRRREPADDPFSPIDARRFLYLEVSDDLDTERTESRHAQAGVTIPEIELS
jgi:hypothetical protein